MKSLLFFFLTFNFLLVFAQKNKKQGNSEREMIERFTQQLDDSTSAFIFPFTLANSGESNLNPSIGTDSILCRIIITPSFRTSILFRIEGLNGDFKLTVKQEYKRNELGNLSFTSKQKKFNSDELQNLLNNLIKGNFYSLPKIQEGTPVSDATFYSFELATSGRTHFSKGPHLNKELEQLMAFMLNFGDQNELFIWNN